jgi:bifunctional enzyme CysN/CysC
MSEKTLFNEKEDMNVVFVGHVDHGKSTIIGRLLADTNALPEGKLEQVKEMCRRNSKPFEYAFLLDALKDERSQGITIDSARCFFKSKKRQYIILDAPGHKEFLKNMITGASRAEAALLVIDANEGVRENSKRHGYMLSMLGINQITVLVNKMDLVNYNRKIYDGIEKEYREFLKEIDIIPQTFIPVSGKEGDNIAEHKNNMSWYGGKTVLQMLDSFKNAEIPEDKPFRMPIQGVYKFTKDGDNRRIIAGTVTTGKIRKGDEVIFYPSGKKTTVKTIESFNRENPSEVSAGIATGFTTREQIYIKRGEIATISSQQKPKVSTKVEASLFWLGKEPMTKGKDYYLKIGTERVVARLEKVDFVLDSSTLKKGQKDEIERYDVANCTLTTQRPIAFDYPEDVIQMSRFVIVDDYRIKGGGIIQKTIEDEQKIYRDMVHLRNYKWIKSDISKEERSEKYSQKASLIIITGSKGVRRKNIARALEKRLFSDGKFVYYLGIGSIIYGVDADIKNLNGSDRVEHIRRTSEIAHILLESGMILIVTAIELTKKDLEISKTIIDGDDMITVWVGKNITTDIDVDVQINNNDKIEESVNIIKSHMQDRGVIFKP